jgi:hypothetical protein
LLWWFAAFAAAPFAFGVGVLEQIFGIAGRNNFMAAAARIIPWIVSSNACMLPCLRCG